MTAILYSHNQYLIDSLTLLRCPRTRSRLWRSICNEGELGRLAALAASLGGATSRPQHKQKLNCVASYKACTLNKIVDFCCLLCSCYPTRIESFFIRIWFQGLGMQAAPPGCTCSTTAVHFTGIKSSLCVYQVRYLNNIKQVFFAIVYCRMT